MAVEEFEREQKYIVLKVEDVKKLYVGDQATLNSILSIIDMNRLSAGKPSNSYVVVNEDEPYAEDVWKIIEAGYETT